MASVTVLVSGKFRAREKVCPPLISGIWKCGDKVSVIELRKGQHYQKPNSDVIVFYGFDGSRDSQITKAFNEYVRAGLKAVYLDLGYFNTAGRYGYHRFSINSRHPNDHFQKYRHPQDRADTVGVKLTKRMKQGENILLCGMSEKCAVFEGFKFEEWEREAIRRIKQATDRPIVYRPKPKRIKFGTQSPPIDGVKYSNPASVLRIEQELANAWAVVSHHSNAGLDALCAGVPAFQDDGVALKCGYSDLSKIESPYLPTFEERRQLLNDVCYTQWNLATEFANGVAWKHFKDEGLIP
jgi:hypothetical protein